MKLTKPLNLFILSLVVLLVQGTSAQESGNKNVITQEREVETFKGINAGGSLDVYLQIGEINSVKVETDENFQDNVTASVNRRSS